MNAVNTVRCNVHRALETEGHIRPPQIIVYCLGKCDDIQPLLAQHVSRLVRTVAAQNYHAVQFQFMIILFHRLYFVQPVLVRLPHQLKGRSGASEYGAAFCQNAREIMSCQNTEIPVNHSLITIQKTINLHILTAARKAFHHASHCRVQGLTITAAGQHSNSFHCASSLLTLHFLPHQKTKTSSYTIISYFQFHHNFYFNRRLLGPHHFFPLQKGCPPLPKPPCAFAFPVYFSPAIPQKKP